MTALVDFPVTDTPDPFDGHVADAGHFDSRPASARVPFHISVQLPAHYLVAALCLGGVTAEELATAEGVREAVATQLLVSGFNAVENAAIDLEGEQLDSDGRAFLEFCRVKVAEAFAPCDPWAVTGYRPAAAPRTRIPYACDPS